MFSLLTLDRIWKTSAPQLMPESLLSSSMSFVDNSRSLKHVFLGKFATEISNLSLIFRQDGGKNHMCIKMPHNFCNLFFQRKLKNISILQCQFIQLKLVPTSKIIIYAVETENIVQTPVVEERVIIVQMFYTM